MSKSGTQVVEISIPIQLGENRVSFPNRCVVCGKPPTKARKLVVRRSEEVGETRGLLTKKTYIQSTVRMLVPYCKDHYVAGFVDKWVLTGIQIAAFLLATNTISYLVRDTFLVRGYWALLVVVVGLAVGMAFSDGVLLVAQRLIGLKFPAILDVPRSGVLTGERGVSLFFSKSLLGLTADLRSLKLLGLIFLNPMVADKVRKLNTGTPDEMTQIEAWPETIGVPSAAYESGTSTEGQNKQATTSLALGIVAIPLAGCLGFGALPGIAALITGLKARRQVRESGGSQKGEGKALAGMILGGMSVPIGIASLFLVGGVILGSGAREGTDTTELEFRFSCINSAVDVCVNHYGSASQQCETIDEKSPERCPQSYRGHKAIGVCGVDAGPDIYIEVVPYLFPQAEGECENLPQGTWSDSYTP